MPIRIASPLRRRGQRGSSLLEGALTMTAFMAILFGLIDFSRMVWLYNTLGHAAREGTRYAIVRGRNSGSNADEDAIANVVKSKLIGFPTNNATVGVSWIATGAAPSSGVANRPGDSVRVSVSYNFDFMLPFIPSGTVPMRSVSQMTISQ